MTAPTDDRRDAVAGPVDWPVGRPEPERADLPAPDLRCCFNCRSWKVREWPHCQSSGAWGGKYTMPAEPGCVFMPATRGQMLTRHGYKRRPTWRSLPSDE